MRIRVDFVGGMYGGAKTLVLFANALSSAGVNVVGRGQSPYFPTNFRWKEQLNVKADIIVCSALYYTRAMPAKRTIVWHMGPTHGHKLNWGLPKGLIAMAKFIFPNYAPEGYRDVNFTLIPCLVHPDFKNLKTKRPYDLGFMYWPRRAYKTQPHFRRYVGYLATRYKICVIGDNPGIPNVPYLGRVTDPVRLVQILNATKMWVVDNLFESDSTMAHEAISCGAKVAAFKSFWTKEICQRFLPGFYELDVTPILSPFDILSDPQNEACAKAKINLEALGQGIAEALSDNKIPNATFVHNHSPKKMAKLFIENFMP